MIVGVIIQARMTSTRLPGKVLLPLAGALSGFLVIAPVLATSLYALSRALERKETANWSVVGKTWLNWQHSHFNKWGQDYWCMVQFGALLALDEQTVPVMMVVIGKALDGRQPARGYRRPLQEVVKLERLDGVSLE